VPIDPGSFTPLFDRGHCEGPQSFNRPTHEPPPISFTPRFYRLRLRALSPLCPWSPHYRLLIFLVICLLVFSLPFWTVFSSPLFRRLGAFPPSDCRVLCFSNFSLLPCRLKRRLFAFRRRDLGPWVIFPCRSVRHPLVFLPHGLRTTKSSQAVVAVSSPGLPRRGHSVLLSSIRCTTAHMSHFSLGG